MRFLGVAILTGLYTQHSTAQHLYCKYIKHLLACLPLRLKVTRDYQNTTQFGIRNVIYVYLVSQQGSIDDPKDQYDKREV